MFSFEIARTRQALDYLEALDASTLPAKATAADPFHLDGTLLVFHPSNIARVIWPGQSVEDARASASCVAGALRSLGAVKDRGMGGYTLQAVKA